MLLPWLLSAVLLSPPSPEPAFNGLPSVAGLAVSPQGGLFATVPVQGGLVIQIFGSQSWTVLARTGGRPRGLAFDAAGDLYVADNALGRILRITPWGEVAVAADRCGGAPLVSPEGVAYGDAVYFTDTGASRVCRVGADTNAELVTSALKMPGAIAASAGELFVADSARIWRAGKQLREFADGPVAGLAVSDDGLLCAAFPNRLAVLDPAGKLAQTHAAPQAAHLAFGGVDGRTLFIAEAAGGAVLKLRLPVSAPVPAQAADSVIREKIYRFSTDDNIWFLRDIARNADRYQSIFDNPYLAMWRDLHRKYGTKFHHNLYYQTDGFNLSQMPGKFRSEWQRNSDWMRLSFHALANDPDRPYVHASAEQITRDYRLVVREIERFAGQEVLHPVTTVHWGETTLAAARALRREGIRILAGYFDVRNDLPSVSYYLPLPRMRYLMGHDYWKDTREDMIFVRHDIVINTVPLAGIDAYLDRIAADPNQSQIMELMIHEQYFYPDYRSYEPDYRERVEKAI
ncbi:MAG: hypothetical protein HY822_03525, partial [Acidobacteria bacterium]|nr:hypothetical protein [Acidobacteriota bacterium]